MVAYIAAQGGTIVSITMGGENNQKSESDSSSSQSGSKPREVPAQGEKESVPNPNGSRGSPRHQDRTRERIRELEDEGYTHVAGGDKKEETVRTPGGNKESRRPDITMIGPDGKPYRENIGRQNQNGTPVSRERKALEDIQNATGQCAFTPYTKQYIS